MDARTRQVALSLGINPDSLPPNVMRVLDSPSYQNLSETCERWARHPNNRTAIAYEIENEHERGIGLVLRNLHTGKEDRSQISIKKEGAEKPYWHNWSPSLPTFWGTGVAVLVEGPKDARVLWNYGIPAVAYLGAVPSKKHLQCVRRYCHSAVWIPDHESDMLPEVVERRDMVPRLARKLDIRLTQIELDAKDPGDLIGRDKEIDRIKTRIDEVVTLSGGGYRNLV